MAERGRIKFALCNEAFEGWSWADTVQAVAGAGYDGIEIAPFTLAESVKDLTPGERATIRRQAEEAGLEIVGLHWLFVSPKGLHVTTDDETTRRRTTAYMQALIHACGDLGGRVMIIGSPEQREVQEGVPYRVAWRRFVDMIEACLDDAAARGVTLCMEALPADSTNFVTSLDEAVEMVRQVDHPNFQTMFDVHNARLETEPLPALLRRTMPYVRHVHVQEMDGSYPGAGDFDFGAILSVLQEEGYQGYVSAEVFDFSPGAELIARQTIVTLRAALKG
jgi:D-psicose/D-tagatose/L-ribulose 3-epimerase